MDTNDIRKSLETEYDIPFVVTESSESGEPAFMIGPKNPGKELFAIRISFRNQIRLYMDFVPEKYSAQFIESMGNQPTEDRARFIAYAKLLRDSGARCDVGVNGSPLNLTSPDDWPASWRSIKIHVTKMPVFEDGEDYSEAAYKWGSMLIGMVLSLTDIVPIEEDKVRTGFSEGNVQRIETNRYERNPLNRKLCLAVKGYDCKICGMNFERRYGEIGRSFIHVHHIVPVSQLGPGYIIDPLHDLIPVCPNCHAMLHRTDPPLLPDELRARIKI